VGRCSEKWASFEKAAERETRLVAEPFSLAREA
jgi:hypothetical protein